MNAPAPEPAFPDATCRRDGWTRERRRLFLEALAERCPVGRACAHVGMSKVSAYKLRRRDPGFALAWSAALASVRYDDCLIPTDLAINNAVEIVVRKNGTIVRRLDNRRAIADLLRLDRQIARLEARSGLGQVNEAASPGFAHDLSGFVDPVSAKA